MCLADGLYKIKNWGLQFALRKCHFCHHINIQFDLYQAFAYILVVQFEKRLACWSKEMNKSKIIIFQASVIFHR